MKRFLLERDQIQTFSSTSAKSILANSLLRNFNYATSASRGTHFDQRQNEIT